ncbi:hypothetical protein UlMin_003753 [Ulmus minor]
MGSSDIVQFLCLVFLVVSITKVESQKRVFNVMSYGAIADGKSDNTKAIVNAWNLACESTRGGVVLIPKGSFLVNPIVLKGTCKGEMSFLVKGTLKAPTDRQYWVNLDHWISFQYLNNFILGGGGTLDGQGASAWSSNTCSRDPNCKQLPTSLRLDFVTNASIKYINLINSKNFHMNIFSSHDLKLNHIRITAPKNSPNTDGIHIADSTNLQILNSIISTGDDCISIGPGTHDVDINNIECGPGHGINVSGLLIRHCNFTGTDNGVRIKTWAPSSPSNVYNLTFEHLQMFDVSNPIIIDQHYCPSDHCAHQGSSQVQIRDVKFQEIWGSSRSEIAVDLRCSQSRPCQQIELKDINLSYNGRNKGATSQCYNVKGVAYGKQQPPSCL